ncbi:unnamed protein product [Closterium sp. NIES-54]
MVCHCLVSSLLQSLAPLPCLPVPPCTPCVEGRQRTTPHSSFPPTTAPFQTLHLDVWGPSPVLGPSKERYFLIVVDDYSGYTTVFPLRRKADILTVLELWLLARGGAQSLCRLRLLSDRDGEFSSTRLETFIHGQGIIQSYTLPASSQQNGVAERRIGLVMEVSQTSMCHAGAPQFLWPQAVLYTVHQLNFPPSPPFWRLAPSVSGGAGGTVAEREGTGAAGASGVGSKGARGVGMEDTPVEDTTASSWRPRPASPPGFPSVPQFPPRSSLRPVAAEPGGVPAGGIGGHWGVGGGGAGSGGVGAGGIGTVAPAPRTPPQSSLTVLHNPLSDYLRASRPVVSRVLSALVTHPSAPLSSVSVLVTIGAGFAPSHRLDYAAHLVSGPAHSTFSGGALVFPLEVLQDRQFELGFLAAAVPHLRTMLLAPEGDPNALDIPIPCTHAEAVSGRWASYWIAAEEAEMASYRSTGTHVDAVPPPRTNIVSGRWLYKVKRPPGSPPVLKARYVVSQREGVDFF